MKTVALLIYAEASEAVKAECRRQMADIPAEEYEFELFVDPDLDQAWRAAGEKDLPLLYTTYDAYSWEEIQNYLDAWSEPGISFFESIKFFSPLNQNYTGYKKVPYFQKLFFLLLY